MAVSANASHIEVTQLGPWFHNLHLPDGTQTAPGHPLGDYPTVKWRQIAPYIPERLSGYEVLDVGCNAGFYSFELARRGARLTGIDIDPRYLRQAQWAARRYALEDHITFRQGSVYSVANLKRQYDIVWFLGVLYHLRHPLLSLDERALMNRPGWPRMAFIEGAVENDPTNWWAPDPQCVEAMVRAAGFSVTARPGHEIYICEPNHSETRFNATSRRDELQALLRPTI